MEITSKDKCSGCYACTNTCPKNCIQMVADEEGFWYPSVDKEKCIDCGLCEKVCPIIHKWHSDDSHSTIAMAAINQNEEIRLKSSSGGIFTLLAEQIIKQGGVVFGAAFTDDFKTVNHICVDNTSDLEKLRGSKYVQSKIGDTYKYAKKYLDSGRPVLFTGTPCQIDGLYAYLRNTYEKLYTQDIICHGVPSPMVWEKYLEERERMAASKTQRMFFRHKKYGWKTFAVLFEFSNNTAYIKSLREDSFMRAFLSNSCLRPSCHACSFKTVKRQSDITLADFWGVQYVLPDMDDDKGISIILTHSEKGNKLIENISKSIKSQEISTDIVKKYNPAVRSSSKVGQFRKEYLHDVQFESTDVLADRYFKLSMKSKIKANLAKYGILDKIMKLRH